MVQVVTKLGPGVVGVAGGMRKVASLDAANEALVQAMAVTMFGSGAPSAAPAPGLGVYYDISGTTPVQYVWKPSGSGGGSWNQP